MTLTDSPPAVAEGGQTRGLDPRWPVELLWRSGSDLNGGEARGGVLPAELAARFAAPLSIPSAMRLTPITSDASTTSSRVNDGPIGRSVAPGVGW